MAVECTKHGEFTPNSFCIGCHREKAVAEAVASKDARIAELEGELEAIALATGYGERPEGQGGVHRAAGEVIAAKFRERERRTEELEDAMTRALAEAESAYVRLDGIYGSLGPLEERSCDDMEVVVHVLRAALKPPPP